MKSSAPEIIIDSDGYPTEQSLALLEAWEPSSFDDAGLFVGWDLPEIWESTGYGTARVAIDKDGQAHVFYSTGGWSGNEELMGVVMQKFALTYHWNAHFAGGHYIFKTRLLNPATNDARPAEDALAARDAEIERLSRFIAGEGYVRCDIPACNCDSFHGGHAYERLREIREDLEESACLDLNGVTTRGGVATLIADRDALRREVAELREERAELTIRLESARGALEQARELAQRDIAELREAVRDAHEAIRIVCARLEAYEDLEDEEFGSTAKIPGVRRALEDGREG